MKTFEQAWAEKEAEGYRYGADALEQVRFGWEIACATQEAEIKALREQLARTRVRQPIETAPRDGTVILVYFRQHGWMSVRWTDIDDDSDSEYAHWCVDDYKHGPFPVRGYKEGDDECWMPLPNGIDPAPQEKQG